MKISSLLIFVFSVLLTISSLVAQTGPVKNLPPFSVMAQAKWQAQRSEAESIAVRQHMPIRVDRADGTAFELQRFENNSPIYYVTENLPEATVLGTDKLWPGASFNFNLAGDSTLLGEWDQGAVRSTHQEFGTRVAAHDGALAAHSTHVAGTMIAAGVVSNAKGMSYHASLTEYDWNNDVGEMGAEAAAGLHVSNHSYGTITGWYYNYFSDGLWAWFGSPSVSQTEDYHFGFYAQSSADFDNVVRNNPYYLPCIAAGNDRGEGPSGTIQHWVYSGAWTKVTVARNLDGNTTGYDCISGTSLGKNVLTVGAIYRSGGMSTFSGWGPADDGRIKPDVVGVGVSVYSTLETADNAYGTLSGTSMATPNVSGSLGLLLQYQNRLHPGSPFLASTLKGLVIHTVQEWGPNPGPDYMFGWGLTSTLNAAQLMRTDSADGAGSHIRELTFHQGDTLTFDIGSLGTSPLKATICWTDPAGTPVVASLNPTNKMLVNDLDLRIIRKRDKSVYYPWILDKNNPSNAATTGDNNLDNVEQVYLPTTERTIYTVRITNKGTISGASQVVSLIMSGNVVNLGPALVAGQDSFAYRVPVGTIIHDSLKLTNYGDSALTITPTVPDSIAGWVSVLEPLISLNPLDSTILHFTIDSHLLHQWSTLNGNFILTNNDIVRPLYPIKLHLELTGPTVQAAPLEFVEDVGTGVSKSDSLKVKNTGYIPLTFGVADTGAIPPWLQITSATGTLAPGDSAWVHLDFNLNNQADGDYPSAIAVSSNDSVTGTVNIPVVLHIGTRRLVTLNVGEGWNMLSLPVIPLDGTASLLLPRKISSVFAYNGSYSAQDPLAWGTGYWVKFDSSDSFFLDGHTLTEGSVAVLQGWNLIGSLTKAVHPAAISADPAGIVISAYYGYNRRYTITDSLYPGRAYWVRTNQAGTLTLNSDTVLGPQAAPSASPSIRPSLNSISITDAAGISQQLFFGGKQASLDANAYSLPPAPPAGGFDVRFQSGSSVALLQEGRGGTLPIRVQGLVPPVTLSWNILAADSRGYSLTDAGGKNVVLAGTGSKTIDAAGSTVLQLSATSKEIPDQYALHQNYPNPFNPATTIRYELPEAAHVKLAIYNVLGNEVQVLVNGNQEAGYKSFDVNASSLPSGLYFYRLQTDKFTAIRKMMLVK